jgi:uncharacterized protein (TIGR02996 family)
LAALLTADHYFGALEIYVKDYEKLALLHGIAAAPEVAGPRLPYADWLAEHGDMLHAELIRVQCELAAGVRGAARRNALLRREGELLAYRSFHLPDVEPLTYKGGMVFNRVSLQIHSDNAWLDVASASAFVSHYQVKLTQTNVTILDKVPYLMLDLARTDPDLAKALNKPVTRAALRHVSALVCCNEPVSRELLTALASMPDAANITTLEIVKTEVPLKLVADLVLSSHVNGIRWLILDGDEYGWVWNTKQSWPAKDIEQIAAFIQHIGTSAKARHLEVITLYHDMGDRIANALIEAPNLQPSRMELIASKMLTRTTRNAMKKRFGKSLVFLK